ncbi:hypothetical protein Gogos_004522 [Gossypium gossypioides]|uniref:Myb-like domain-containing protein n=1 Tax=Gossypium gossypioides TaxID=34282 RepID=A0A7J9CGN8_GOSGO|nr:hypothetical protein [Gossypium gossypioides]
MQPVKYGAQNLQERLMEEDGYSSVFSISNPLHCQQLFQQNLGPLTHQLLLHQHQFQQPNSAVGFKLGLDEISMKKEAALALNHPQQNGNDQHSLLAPHCWHPQEDSPIKQPFWKSLNRCDEDSIRQCTSERSKHLDNKYRFFGELEAIYGLGGETTQAGSGSALTGENYSPANVGIPMPSAEFQGHNVGANGRGDNVTTGVDHGSEGSIGEQASLRKIQKKKRKKKMKEQLCSMLVFFETLVKQVMDHQEGLHKRFLEVIETMDKERSAKEESWRQRQAEKRKNEAIARANEQALASNREAVIVSYLEKLTGQSINLPPRTPLLVKPESAMVPLNDNNSRWPRAEVEALIQVRCDLEAKFREPGLKGPVWEEVSSFMASLGYQRSAKRCKEKWENINKYFRKSKENGKKRCRHSKTCTYFHQLDQLYSRMLPTTCPTSPPSPLINNDIDLPETELGAA